MNSEENRSISQFYLNCTNMTITMLKHMNLSRGITAVVCVAVLAVVLVVLLCSRSYQSILQRMFVYLVLATMINELCLVGTLEHQFHYTYQTQVCTALGFLTHWSSIISLFCATEILFYAVLLVGTSLSMRCSTVVLSKRQKRVLEGFFLLTFIFLPLTVLWIAIVYDYYGLAVAWCWIKAIDENCNTVGLKEQLILGYGICEAMGIIGIIAMAGITISYCRISSSFIQVKKLLLQSLGFTVFILIYILVTNSALAIRIYSGVTGWTQHYGMWLYHGAMYPVCQLIVPLGFLGSFYCKELKHKMRYLQPSTRNQYNLLKTAQQTSPASDRSSLPSNTFFKAPYTDNFTSVRKTDYEATCSV